jgi:hypothetical protein
MQNRTGIATFVFSIATLVGQDTAGVGSIAGFVLGDDKRPSPGVRICIGDEKRCAVSDPGGRFRLGDLRPGIYQLEVTAAGDQPSVTTGPLEVRAGLEDQVEVVLPKLDAVSESVTVSESVFVAPEEVKNSGYLIQSREIFESAGALQDVSRYVQTLPGVAIGSDDFRNDIIVRGGSPLENLFVVDNIEIPNINAFANFASAGGTVGILDAALIEDATFLTGGYPAPFINRTSSVLQVAQREGNRDEFRSRVTLGFAGVGGIAEGPLAGGRGSWIVSARRSFLDLFTDDVGFGGVPVLYTFNAKALYDVSPRDRIWAVSISGVDNIRLGARENKTTLEEIDNFDIRYDGWRSANGFNWQRLFGTRGVGLLGFSHSEARVNSSVKDLVRNGVPQPSVPVADLIAGSPTVFRESSREGESTIKYDLTAYLPYLNKVQAGGSFKLFGINYDTASPFGNDSPYSPVAGLNPFTLQQDFTASQSGGYFQSSRSAGRRLNVTWGARFDRYQYIGRSRVSPRAGVSYRITDKLSWRASYGTYYQQPFFLFLAAFPENRGALPFRADHYVTGFSYVASSSLRFTVEGYRKNYKDYPAASQIPTLSLANIGDTFNVRDILFPLASAGRGHVEGVELFGEKRFSDKWFGQANLSFSRSRQAGLDGILRPSSFDYPRVFNAVGGYRLSPKWEFSARISHLSGRPYTPFDEAASSAQRRGVYDLSRVNALRLPGYFRLDVRADRTFIVRDQPLLVFIGAQNITNRRNIANYTWNRRSNSVETNEQLGLFPLIGLEWRF